MKKKRTILIIGKYAPIQGGEATKTYWLAKWLGMRGHKVIVLSACNEVQKEFECHFFGKDRAYQTPKNVSLVVPRQDEIFKFVEWYNPLVEKMTSAGMSILKEHDVDVIVSWYLLPAAIVADNLSRIAKIPMLFQHAGSDLKWLLSNPSLSPYLSDLIARFDGILTNRGRVDFFSALTDGKIYPQMAAIAPEYSPRARPMDLKKVFGIPRRKKVILFLGKVSKGKGAFRLIETFAKLNDPDSVLLFVGEGRRIELARELVKKLRLRNVYFRRPIAPWRIPSLMRAVSVVVVPEYRFGVESHSSRVGLEAICCGTPALISSEVGFAKREYYRFLEGSFVAFSHKKRGSFLNAMREILQNQELRSELKSKCKNVSSRLQQFDDYVDHFEEILDDVLD